MVGSRTVLTVAPEPLFPSPGKKAVLARKEPHSERDQEGPVPEASGLASHERQAAVGGLCVATPETQVDSLM